MPDLSALLSPKSVAVIGASPDATILRGRVIKVMLQHAYAGNIYPVSRSSASIQGLKAYPSIAAVPQRVDLAVLIVPAEFVGDELERCAEAGVKAALILSSGFAEDGSPAGLARQQRLCEIARRYDIALGGPNAEGFANTAAALCPTFSTVVQDLKVPLVPEWPTNGRVSVVSQSGGVGFSFFDHGRPKEMAFSHIFTTGNEASLDAFDIVDYLLDEGRTEVVAMFIESIRNPATFRRVAHKALVSGTPLIVAKIGRSEAGRRAAASHTAALAGAPEICQAMFRHYGVIEGEDTEEMVDIAAGFCAYPDRLPAGKRVGIITASGGAGGWIADACAAAGLNVPELDSSTRARIDVHLPSYGSSQNPVDATAQAIRRVGYAELARLASESDRVDAVIAVSSARSAEALERERDTLARVARETRKPIMMWSYTLPCAESARLLGEARFPLFTNMRHCARTIVAMADYRALRERYLRPQDILPGIDEQRRKRVRAQLAELGPVLCEYECKPLLAQYGIELAVSRLAKTSQQAEACADELDGAVALKIQSPDIPHKSEAGGVAINVRRGPSVRREYEAVLENVRVSKPQAEIRGVLVQAMASPGLEMILGIQRDAAFGPMLMVGLGGIHAEVFRDFALAPAPLSAVQARELLGRLRARALFQGVRGAPPVDIESLVQLMVALSEFANDHAEVIDEIDLNPVIVHPGSAGVSIVDALIVKRAASQS